MACSTGIYANIYVKTVEKVKTIEFGKIIYYVENYYQPLIRKQEISFTKVNKKRKYAPTIVRL